jgi:hypothetical protein
MSESMDATPDQQTDMPIFAGLSSMKVKFDASDNARSKSLFGNGRMQLKVVQGRFTIEARPSLTAGEGHDDDLENDSVHPQFARSGYPHRALVRPRSAHACR